MRKINVEELRLNSVKPLIYLKFKYQPEIDMVSVIVEDNDDSITISNPFLVIPIQDPNTQRLGLMLRPWSFTLPKDETVVIPKSDLVYYYELKDKSMIDSYIGSTTNIEIAGPSQMPRAPENGIIDLSERFKRS